jgi:hypothetical protein
MFFLSLVCVHCYLRRSTDEVIFTANAAYFITEESEGQQADGRKE